MEEEIKAKKIKSISNERREEEEEDWIVSTGRRNKYQKTELINVE